MDRDAILEELAAVRADLAELRREVREMTVEVRALNAGLAVVTDPSTTPEEKMKALRLVRGGPTRH